MKCKYSCTGFSFGSGSGFIAAAAAAVLSITLLFSSGAVADSDSDSQARDSLPLEDLQLFAEIFGKIKTEYVDKADDATLLRDAIRGMLDGLDPHSAFLDADAFKEMRISTEGKFGGLGVEITTEDGYIKVVAPIDDTPAQRAGILPGDLIVKLDGVPVHDLSLNEAVKRMRGPPGSKIVLTISRESQDDMIDIKLERAIIRVTSVRGELLEQGFGYIRITSFQSGAGVSLRKRIKTLKRKNKGALKGLLLDLRNNPGGVLQSAVEVSDAFLDAGVIVSTRGRGAGAEYSFTATPGDATADAPLVVLVNSGSASSSEIVAGALQDHHRAIIMGSRTFGKASVQTVIPVSGGGALKLTTARYYTPSGRSIQALGIEPDIFIEPVSAAPLSGTRKLREADLAGHLENEADAGADKSAKHDSALVARDHQVAAALNMLKGMNLVRQRGLE